MPADQIEFAADVCRTFALGAPAGVVPLHGGGNIVWRVDTPTGAFVVKELPAEDLDPLTLAAAFEAATFRAGVVAMAEPCPDPDGRYARILHGSRGLPVAVRVHRYIAGTTLRQPITPSLAAAAGRAMAAIQQFGAYVDSSAPVKPLWESANDKVLKQFVQRWPELGVDPARARGVLLAAERIIADRQLTVVAPTLSHCDHKPENCLLDGDSLVVLDWDETGRCDPRTEAVESGLRWSGVGRGGPDPELFASFVRGYRCGGWPFEPLTGADCAKWIAGLGSWFEFMARCSLGEWAEISVPPRAAANAAAQALRGLADTINDIPDWCDAINSLI